MATHLVFAGAIEARAQGAVNIYTYREPALIEPLLSAFTAKTGIKTNVVFASSGLNERMAAGRAHLVQPTCSSLPMQVD